MYTYSDLINAYKKLRVRRGGLIYVVSELWRLREYAEEGAENIARAHYRALREILGDEGTIVVCTASLNLCNTDIPFDLEKTPSDSTGIFSEFVRQLPCSLRSFHPFISYCAQGPLAGEITRRVSRHAFGPQTPIARLIEHNALMISVGQEPHFSANAAHHVEQIMGVPFRYTKEFMHPVVRNGKICVEPFYRHVWYRDTGMVKDRYKALFERLREEQDFSILKESVGRGRIWSYALAEFVAKACKILAKDLYVSCKEKPTYRPYQK